MKRLVSITITALLSLITVFAEQIKVTDLTMVQGGSATVEVELDNVKTNLIAFQMDLTLPQGVSIEKTGCTLSSRITDEEQVLTIGKLESGAYRLTSTSFTLTPISGTSGVLLTLKLKSKDTFVQGQASISNILFSTVSSEEVSVENTSFSINTLWTLTYKVDGVEYKTEQVPYGTVLTQEEAPSKEGYTFSGWSEIPETMPANNVTVTGSFAVNQYIVTFKVDGEVFAAYTQNYGTIITVPDTPTKKGYTFSGWKNVASTVPAQDVTYDASFTVNKYLLRFVADGNIVSENSVDYGSAITAPSAPEKEGYTFVGWGDVPTTMPDNDLVFTASYTINQYTVTFKVDGEIYEVYTLDYGADITTPTTPQKEGYSFSGWNTKIAETMPAYNLEYTGSFLTNPYTITYFVDGEEYYSTNAGYGSQLTPIDSPQKTGYTFSGWDNVPATMPANDVVVRGTFSINQYTVTFKVDGEVYKSYTQDYGTTINPPEDPTKEGYVFNGWNTKIAETVPAYDLEYTGSFSVNTFKLSYYIDDEEYYSTNINYGESVTPIDDPQKTGYTFSGWEGVPSTMPANDVTVTGNFTINQYTVTFKVDGEVFKTFTLDYGAAITAPAGPTKEGYTFGGWKNVASTVPAQDVTYDASFTVNKYTLKFVADGNVVSEESVDFGSTIAAPSAPAKEGYTFVTWGEVASTMPATDVTYTAEYRINQYTVTFKVDGEVYKTFTLDYGAAITAPAGPTKEGYTFGGWKNVASTVPAQDVIYDASFTVNKYTLKFVADGNVVSEESVDFGSTIAVPSAPAKEGYTFATWGEVASIMPAADVTYTAEYRINQYTVTFKVDGEVYKTFTQDYGTVINPPKNPTKEGYTFSGWNTKIAETVPAYNLEYIGSFLTNPYKITYILDGEEYYSINIGYGESVTPIDDPQKTGYTFSGWEGVPSTMPANDVTVTGNFAINQYTVTFKVDGEVYKTLTLDYGAAITAPAAPTKEGYTFGGWKNVASTVPAQDVTYDASFTVNKYTLKFVADGNVVSEESVDFSSTIAVPSAPAKEGYTFVTWGEVASTMPATDVTYTAEYRINQYTVTFKVEGEVYKTFTLDYGAAITAPAGPTKEGYTFGGWKNVASTVPAQDVTYDASFTVNKYTLKFVADGNVVSEESVDFGSTIAAPTAPAKEGYTFVTWGEVASTMPATDVTYTAEYRINQYTVTFKVDDEIYKTFIQDYGTTIIAPEDPSKEGYTFSGWNTKIAERVAANDLVYTGSFTVNAYQLTYIVDGEEYYSSMADYGTIITAIAAPQKTGHTFSGWDNVPIRMPASDVTVTGNFTINQYTVTFKVDGEVFKTSTQDYGTTIATPQAPTKEGYTFGGWKNVASTMPDKNVTYEACFNINKYTLKFVADGTVVSEKSVDYGSAITAPNAPAKTGHTFVSWGNVAATMPAKDVTYTAQYKVNQYKLTYMIDGRVYKTYTLDYNSVINPEGDAEDDDYYYGWEEIPDRMPDHDVTVNAYITGIAAAGKGITNGKYEIYTIDGKKLNNLQKGVNIIRLPNGKTKKVVIR